MTEQLDDLNIPPQEQKQEEAAPNDLPYTDRDILLKKGGRVSSRQANQMYHDFLKANYMIYCCLPSAERRPFARNIFLYIHRVLGRKFIKYNQETNEYCELQEDMSNKQNDAVEAISAAIRAEWVKIQASKRWVLGNHDPGRFHNGNPFLHKESDDVWRKPSLEEVNQILETPHGLTDLLVLPAGIRHPQDEVVNLDLFQTSQSHPSAHHAESHTNQFDLGGNDDMFSVHSSDQSESVEQRNDAI